MARVLLANANNKARATLELSNLILEDSGLDSGCQSDARIEMMLFRQHDLLSVR